MRIVAWNANQGVARKAELLLALQPDVLEVSGEARKDKQAKVAAAEHLWIPAVNNWGGAGRWAFLEVTDPWDAESLIRKKYLEPPDAPA